MFVFLFNYSDEAGGASNVNVIIADILGGNILNMAALCFIIVLFIKNIKYIKSGVTEFVNIGSLVVINILFILGIFCKGAIMLGTINIISLFVLLIYVINIFFMVKDKKTKQFENNIKTKLSKKQLG
jgi:phosphatidylserine synthase